MDRQTKIEYIKTTVTGASSGYGVSVSTTLTPRIANSTTGTLVYVKGK